MQRGRLLRLAAGLAALAMALGSIAIAMGPGRNTTYAGHSTLAATLSVGAGVGLIPAGLVTSFFGSSRRTGDLAVLAGVVWFAPVWVGWHNGPPLVRSVGMLAAGFALPLFMHLILAAPSGRLRGAAARALVLTVYLEAGLVAVALGLVRDPFFDLGCWANCTDNVFLLRSLPGLARGIEWAHRWFTAVAAIALVIVIAWRLLTDSGPARRALLPFALPAALLAGAVVAHAVVLQLTTLEDPSQPVFQSIFIVECAVVLLLAAGLVWVTVRMRLQRRAVAQITANLGQAPPQDLCGLHSLKRSMIPNSGSPTGYRIPSATSMLQVDRSPSPPSDPGVRSPRSCARAAKLRSFPIPRPCPTWSRRSAPLSGWLWRTSACRPRRWLTSTSCERRGSALWRLATPSDGSWNVTCTMARSSDC